ncbi:MAG TPA: Fe-S oxidoreductase [Sphingobium sp.]|nr:Fe-S oxidoreductase [Sphingobium sp.]
MKSIMLAGAAVLAFTTGLTGAAIAQGTSTTMQPPLPGEPAVPATPATPAEPGSTAATPATPATPPPAADPNAGQPTGEVPASTGMAPAPAGVPQDPSAPMGTSANPVTVGGNMTPPPTEKKDYPLCSRTIQDSCINPGEAKGVRKASRRRR